MNASDRNVVESPVRKDLAVGHPDPDPHRRLRRARVVATLLLLVMLALTITSTLLQPSFGIGLLKAAATAGLIGGLADWFAVTALFRHPLGVPVPHTAIIPAQKQRLGRALGRFVAEHVFTQAEVARNLQRLNLPDIAAGFLADPQTRQPAAQALANLLPRLLASIEDGRARRIISRLIPKLVGGAPAGRIVARALRALIASGRHQDMLTFILIRLRDTLSSREDDVREAIETRVREQGGRLIGWAVGASIAKRILTAVNAELDKVGPSGSELRDAFETWVRHEADQLETDPQRAAEIGRAIKGILSQEVVRGWMYDVWSRLRISLENDARDSHGRVASFADDTLAHLATLLKTDPLIQSRFEESCQRAVRAVLPSVQTKLADFIGGVVGQWDEKALTGKLEQRIGPDLQWIRINGTVFGFLAGGAVYLVLFLATGHGGL